VSIAERVAKGAALLDKKNPGWWKPDAAPIAIDLDDLELSSDCNCVLGQLAGNYAEGVSGLGIHLLRQEVTHGFLLDLNGEGDDLDWPPLTAEWKRVITARRAQVAR
jgi:hypothetical protein